MSERRRGSVCSNPETAAGGAKADESVTVGVRLRPLLPYEKGQKPVLKVFDDKIVSVVDGSGVKFTGPHTFQFDYAMDSTDPSSPSYVDAAKCYDLMGRRMLEHMMLGYSTCLFCYGQTGTGKTTTIMGKPSPVEEQGILLRLITELFSEVTRLQGEGYECTVQLQMLEVYNEKISDLLVPRPKAHAPGSADAKKVDVHVHPEIGVYLTGATELLVDKAEKCAQAIEFGNSMKTVHATAMNSQSSRGHTVVKINVERKGGAESTVLRSEVYFADLAGRENEKTTLVTGDRLIELTFINRSLLQLANCIQTLGKAGMAARRKTTMKPQTLQPPDGPEDSPPPPSSKRKDMSKFRNSKLTLLLSNALSGNSRTAMIGTLSPAIGNFEESYSTLKFAVTVGAIQVAATKTSEQDYPSLVKKLQSEVAELKAQLSEAKATVHSDPGLKMVETEVRAREELVDKLTKDPKDARRESKTQEHLMQQAMLQYGIKEDSEVPFPRLVNCSDDAGEIGKMLYHIPDDDAEHSLGSDDPNDFRLPQRAGVLSKMCTLRNDGQHVWIQLARPVEDQEHPKAADVRVDGVQLGLDKMQLKHLSCLHFGPATAFYVCMEQVSKDELFRLWNESPADASVEELMSLIMGDERAGQREQIGPAAKKYLGDVCKAQEPESMKSLLKQARDARNMVSRANSITEEVRPGSGLRFELVAHAPVLPAPGRGPPMPELGVRLVRAWGEDSSPRSPSFGIDASSRPSAKLLADAAWGSKAEGYEVLSTWSVEKMADRLELMERPSDYLVDDPWAEYGLGEVQELRNDYEERLHEAHEEQRLLRQEIHQLQFRLKLGQSVDTDKALPDSERTNGSYSVPVPEDDRLETATRLLEMAERNRSLVRQILAFQQTGSLPEAKAPGRSMQAIPMPKRGVAFGVAATGRRAGGPAGRPAGRHLERSVTLENTEDPNDCESHLSRHTRQRGKGRLTQQKIERAIEQDSICADLEHAERAQIIESMTHLIFENGDLIVMQGKPGNTFFAIHEGKADVFIDGEAVNTLSEGSAFGGLALVCACPRTATLRASGRCAVWAAHGDVFRDVLRKHAKKRLAEHRKFIDCMHLFDGLQPSQKDRLGDLFFTKVFEGGKQVLQEGGGVTAIYFVKHGSLSCRSLVPGARASRQLGPGDCFGARALVENIKLDETVETLERCELLGISVEALKEALGADVGPKLQREFILRGFRSSPAFSLFSSTQHQAMIEEIRFKDYAPGSLIDGGLRCGVVVSGAVVGGGLSTVRLDRGGWFEDGSMTSRPGEGQQSMFKRKQTASSSYVVMGGGQETEVETLAAAPDGARVGQLSSESFAAVLQRMGLLGVGDGLNNTDAVSFTRRLELLKRVHIFRHLSRVQMSALANSFSVQGYQKGAFVIREEEVGRQFFVIANGEVQVKIKGERIRAIGKHGTFGERSLLFHERRTASVEVTSSSAELLVLGIAVFSQIVKGKMQEIMMHRIKLQDTSASLKDLVQVRVIGVGGMGVVRLVEHKDTRTRYALKRIKKASDGSTPAQVVSECDLLKEMDHPFVMTVVQTYDTVRSTYILTELLTGGELFRVLHPQFGDQVCLTGSQAQFYAGSILLVLEALFDRSIVYRDLKPENVMLDFQGYIKIIDFGISKKLEEGSARTFSVIGTPEYMAPEAFTSKGYGFEVDLWSLGVVIFELLCGRVPFGAGGEQQEVIAAVRNSPLSFPASLDTSARTLLEGLLERRPEKRLGAGMNGYDEVKQAKFFAIDDENSSLFDKIMGRELEPPVVPEEETYCDDDEAEEQDLSDAEELASS